MGDVVLDVKVGGVVHSSTQSCNTVVINLIIFFADYLVFVDYCYNFVVVYNDFLDRMKNLYTSLQACCCCTESRDWLGTMVVLRDVI